MAKSPSKKAPSKPEFKGFINYSLTESEKQAIKATNLELVDYDDWLTKLVEEGYRVQFSYDEYRSCYSAFLSHPDPKHVNSGYLLAGKGSTPLKAFKQAAYIHSVIFDGDWSEHFQAANQEVIDD